MPTTTGKATDFITFSRASNATVTDSDGNIKWAGHNLLTNSESFDASAWVKYNGGNGAPTLTAANAVVAPNGTTTADDFLFPAIVGSTQEADVIQQVTVPSGTFTGGVWVKAKSAGDVGKRFTVAAYNFTSATLFALTHHTLTSDWVLVTASGSCVAGTIQFYFGTVGSTYAGGGNQAAFSCYVWGAHLYRSDLGGMQANTSAYPMYNPTTPKNLLGYTEAFDNAAWTKTATTVTANAVLAPNGLQTADKLIETTANSGHFIGNAAAVTTVSGSPVTLSVYAKAGERSWIALYDGFGAKGKFFNLSTGTIGGNLVAAPTSATITAVGDGWYRCSIVVSAAATCVLSVYLSTDGTTFSYTGDGTSGIYLWGAQLSDSASLDPYVPNHFAAPSAAAYHGPRLDFDGATLSAKGLLVEEQRTNEAIYSQVLNSLFNYSENANFTVTTGVAPDGTATATSLVATAGTVAPLRARLGVTFSATTYTLSIYAKSFGYNFLSLAFYDGSASHLSYFNLSNGTVGTNASGNTASITPVGNGWYRCAITRTLPATSSGQIRIFPTNADNTTTYTADGTSGIYAWGAQLEAGSFATSYIPTTSATATRTADIASVATAAFPYSATEGTIVANVDVIGGLTGSNNASVSLNDGTVNNAHLLYVNAAAPTYVTNTGGVAQQNLSASTITVIANQAFKSALAYKQDDFAATANGATVVTDTSGTVPSGINTMNIGNYATNLRMNGHIRQITYIPRRLSNSELQARTA